MITLKQEPVFTICMNGKELPGWRVVSEWGGFKKLQRGVDVLVVANSSGDYGNTKPFSMALGGFFARHPEGEEYFPIMASPNVLAELGVGAKEQQT